MDPVYRFLRLVLRTALDVHYTDIEVHGLDHVPADGPTMILANHHNGMIDPMLLIAVSERPVRFIGKSTLFRIPILGFVMRRLGCIPAYRQQDPGYVKEKNQELYAAVAQALTEGGVVGLFPEGRSHTDPGVKELKHGAARMALDAEAGADFELGLAVLPAGIHFERSQGWRGKVLMHFAPPIALDGWCERYEQDPRAAVGALTDALREALSGMVLETDSRELYELSELAERLGVLEEQEGGLRGRFERRRFLLDAYRRLKETRPADVDEVRRLLRRYAQLLDLLGVRDGSIAADFRPGRVLGFALRNSTALLLGFPLFAAGTVINAVPYEAARLCARASRADIDVRVSVGMITAIFFFPIWYVVLGWLGWRYLPTAVWLPLLCAGPVLGLVAAAWLDRWRRFGRATWALWLSLRMPACRARLRSLRREILERVEHLIDTAAA